MNKISELDKVRVLVLGDSGVGKTALITLICKEECLSNAPSTTVGCFVDVQLFDYNAKSYFIELLEVGGRSNYELSRNVFYKGINGLILVHDVTNKNSFDNLGKWIAEAIGKPDSFRWKGIL